MTTTTPRRGAHGVRPTGQVCPECGQKAVTRQSLPLPAPVPPRGFIQIRCSKCDYCAFVETKRWMESAKNPRTNAENGV